MPWQSVSLRKNYFDRLVEVMIKIDIYFRDPKWKDAVKIVAE